MIHDIQRAVAPAALSGSSAAVSFYSETLPLVQWCAGLVAIVSGLLGATWVAYQFYHAWQRNRKS